MPDLRKYAQGKACMVRLPGICNGRSETTVLAHLRLAGITGMGLKAPDILGAWSCSSCHYAADHTKDPWIQVAFYQGMARTINELVKEGMVKWSKR